MKLGKLRKGASIVDRNSIPENVGVIMREYDIQMTAS